MPVSIAAIDPKRPDFAGVVSGIDLCQPVSAADAAAIEGGIARFGVLVFHDQNISDDRWTSAATSARWNRRPATWSRPRSGA